MLFTIEPDMKHLANTVLIVSMTIANIAISGHDNLFHTEYLFAALSQY